METESTMTATVSACRQHWDGRCEHLREYNAGCVCPACCCSMRPSHAPVWTPEAITCTCLDAPGHHMHLFGRPRP
eukprot:43251-Chlamydomonas_euryale.AAC.3